MGALIGTIILVLARSLIDFYKGAFSFLPFDPVWLDYMILGGVLLIMLITRPAGLFPEKATKTMRSSELDAIRKQEQAS